MAIKNYTSGVDVFTSLGEIQGALAGHGARQIMVEYDEKGRPTGVTFSIDTPTGRRGFMLPANIDGVLFVFKQQKLKDDRDQAERTGWRNLRDWVLAQMAIIEAGDGERGRGFPAVSDRRTREHAVHSVFQRNAETGGWNMKKAVLISIRPQWCAKIASGEKTIEFRKSRPELKKPFKCYIYCTKADYYTWDLRVSNVTIPFAEKCCGKVIGEFICSDFVLFNGGKKWPDFRENRAQAEAATPEVLKKACLTARELWAYEPKGNPIGWCISDLVIYDTPHELNSFRRVCPEELDCESCAMHSENTGRCGNEALYLRRAPQSWCYVEERHDL